MPEKNLTFETVPPKKGKGAEVPKLRKFLKKIFEMERFDFVLLLFNKSIKLEKSSF